jgi:hypothetical protein
VLLLLLMMRPCCDVICSSPGAVAAVDGATLLVCEPEAQPQKRWDSHAGRKK